MANRTARRNARVGRVPLYSMHGGRPLTFVTNNDAREMALDRSNPVRLSVRGRGVNEEILAARYLLPQRQQDSSPAAISHAEMEANAAYSFGEGQSFTATMGEQWKREQAALLKECDDFVERSHEKTAAYAEIADVDLNGALQIAEEIAALRTKIPLPTKEVAAKELALRRASTRCTTIVAGGATCVAVCDAAEAASMRTFAI